ncbi:MAG TPA: barstar family protein [Planctomycetota bacterium]|nr:barstar family protein [Planctomycetota bacterium]
MSDVPPFVFGVDACELDEQKDFVARIPAGISTLEEFYDVLSRELRFPHYFGRNWDALVDCLGDFHWIQSRRVVILHEDLPALDKHMQFTYLDILSLAVRGWKPGEAHELVVIFPRPFRDRVSRLMKEA